MRTIIRDNYDPQPGDYHERIIIDEAREHRWLFDCDGVFMPFDEVEVVNERGDSIGKAISQKFFTDTVEDIESTADGLRRDLDDEVIARGAADDVLQGEIDAIKNAPDVVDIVATYSELEDYDTSTLTDKDVVRVLTDETHDDQSTYYRWDAENTTWIYVGAAGPYYTKAQTDTLLSAKADKATTYTKTEVDTALSGKQNTLTAGTNISISGDVISATDTTYTAGTGLSLSGTEFSADTTVLATQTDLSGKQNTLTAGSNITISNDTISATDTTYSNFVGTDGTAAGVAGLVPAPTTTDGGKFLKGDGSWGTPTDTTYTAGTNVQISSGNVISATDTTYSNFTGTDGTAAGVAGLVPAPATTDAGKVLGADGTWVTGGPTVVQTTGTSTTDVMSQNAVTSTINGIVITGAGAPTTATVGTVGQIYEDTTNGKLYICTAIVPGTDPDPDTYTWEEVGGDQLIPLTTADYPSGSIQIKAWLLNPGFYINADSSNLMFAPCNTVSTSLRPGKVFYVGGADYAGYKDITILSISTGTTWDWYTVNASTGAAMFQYHIPKNVANYLTSTSTTEALSANQGKVLNEKIEGRIITNAGAPTTSTTGTVGKLYEDTTNGKLYICTAASGGTYTWEEVGKTYSDFTGATSGVAGAHGLVPAPTTSDPDKYLKGDGTWATPPGTTYTAGANITITGTTISATDTTYSNFTGTDGVSAGAAGLVPAPATTDAGKFLKANGTWDTAGAPLDVFSDNDWNALWA